MDRLEQIALEHGLCNCDEMYTNRGLTAPDCPWHAFAVQEAMEQYATEVARHNLERAVSKAVFAVEDNQMDTGGVVFTDDGNMVRKHVVVLKKSITSLEIELI